MVIDKKKLLAKISKYTGFTSLCYFLNRYRKRVLAYHNIIIDDLFDDSMHLDHSIKESNFKMHLKIIESKFDIDLNLSNKESVTLTFDDGYLNQYLIGSKILDEINAKGIFFCSEDLIIKDKGLKMDMIQFWLSYVKEGSYDLKKTNIRIDINNENRRKEWNLLSNILLEGSISLNDIYSDLNEVYSFSKIIEKNKEIYELRLKRISPKFLNNMKLKGHLIGAHSSKHNRLSDLSPKELKEDIELCKNELGKIYNTDIFCYPYGSEEDISNRVIEEIKSSGFKKAFLYGNFPLKKFSYNEYLMPRMILPNTSDKDLINFTLSGAKNMILFRKRLPKI
ncbi:polysaccharide deacetylase family protein [Clostridium chrysemydis]|uniref:polysaccharide deacetylase family protein n=1 Tax=Clostridium chrysemydis TaxID=2665504 RepID=UPI0018846BE4|nr:polysaccharide deacetylase family protein [Clostridium chrysemydis]